MCIFVITGVNNHTTLDANVSLTSNAVYFRYFLAEAYIHLEILLNQATISLEPVDEIYDTKMITA